MISPKNSKKFLPWIKGPAFLLLPENKWPVIPFEKDQVVGRRNEVKPEIDNIKLDPSNKFLTLVNYYSDFQKLIRSLCYIFRVVKAGCIKNRSTGACRR